MPSKKRKLRNKTTNSRARKRLKQEIHEEEVTDEEMIEWMEEIAQERRKKLRELLKERYSSLSDYDVDASYTINIGSDYKSKTKYSKAAYFNIMSNISSFSELIPSNIIGMISELSEGRIVCCAECKDIEFAINRDVDIDAEFIRRETPIDSHCEQNIYCKAIFSQEKIDHIVEAEADRFIDDCNFDETDDFVGFEQSFGFLQQGYPYIVVCKSCQLKYYCLDHGCFNKCARNVNGKAVMNADCKRCIDCKGLYCSLHQDWADWGFADHKKYCTTCGWVIKKDIQNSW